MDSIRVHLPTQQHVVILKERHADRYLPIWIGNFEANAIAMKIQGVTPDRPITHDLVRSTFANNSVTLSISSLKLNNTGLYQRIYNDGNATLIQLSPTKLYSVTFQEAGLPANTPWSVILNGTTSSSTVGNITVKTRKADYSFTVGNVPGFVADISSGNFTLSGNRIVPIRFTSTRTLDRIASNRGVEFFLIVTAAAWSTVGAAVIIRKRRRNGS